MNKCLYCGNIVKNKFCNVSCQNRYGNPLRKKKRIVIENTCKKCGVNFEQIIKENSNNNYIKQFCSKKCANSRIISEVTKLKISKTLKNYICVSNDATLPQNKTKTIHPKQLSLRFRVKKQILEKKCIICNKSIYSKNKCCSKECAALARINGARKGGLISSQKQYRRSKNEIYFAKLCKDYFGDILTNEPMFNGWDADVIIPSEKLAILWNGKWHYEKIKKSHSVKQVQNRDTIKVNEILKSGYTPYIIKDMGKENPKFVKTEFNKLLKLKQKKSFVL